MKRFFGALVALWAFVAPAQAADCPKNGQSCTNAIATDGAGNVVSPATAGNQTAANSSLATIVSQTVGLATSALQSAANTTLSTISSTLSTISANVATAANQATANTTLSSILSALTGPLPAGTNAIGTVTTTPSATTTTDGSSTILTGGTFQQIAAAAAPRKSLEFTNVCDQAGACVSTSDNCYLFIAASGTPTIGVNVIKVVAGDSYLRSVGSIPSDAVLVTCDGNGDHYALKVQ